MSVSAAFEWSTPAEAQTNPCRVSAITSPPRDRTMRAVSRRITSSCRRSVSGPAMLRARAEGSTPVEAHDPPLGLGDDLLRHDHDVTVTELGRRDDLRGEIVPLADLGQALDRDDLDHAQSTPVTVIPACAR